jgi:mitosis inhibitor protein kinase SWE1
MASLWPRLSQLETGAGAFEREGDKVYLAPEILQGRYGKAADVFRYVSRFQPYSILTSTLNLSFGMTILESASNIVVPDQYVSARLAVRLF